MKSSTHFDLSIQSETIIKLKYLGLSEDGYVILYTQAIRYTAKETLS